MAMATNDIKWMAFGKGTGFTDTEPGISRRRPGNRSTWHVLISIHRVFEFTRLFLFLLRN